MKNENLKWRVSDETMARKLSSGNESGAGSWRSQNSSASTSQEISTRPPIYNPEDYAISLKKWTSKASQKLPNDTVTQPLTGEIEMSLRQFFSISDLLNKLKTDLRLSYSSFVQEFVSDPIDGVTLLLELLRSIQQKDPPNQGKVVPAVQKRTLLEENSCLQCLQYCLRCEETVRRLTMSSVGLFPVAVCIMSSVCKTRITSLELLCKICTYSPSSGHNIVSEAISTMRVRFGEPVRFRFLVSMLSGTNTDLLTSGLRFINTFMETSPSNQAQLYIQAELEQAGFNTETFKKIFTFTDCPNESILNEFNRWSRLYLDVETLKNKYSNKCKEVINLKEKVAQLEAQLRFLQTEKDTLATKDLQFNNRYAYLDYHISVSRRNSVDKMYNLNGHVTTAKREEPGGHSTPAEDEGISSSDQDDSEEIANSNREYSSFYRSDDMTLLNWYSFQDKLSEPTIDEVMEDFQKIIDDVQNQNYCNEQKSSEDCVTESLSNLRIRNSNESLSEALVQETETNIVPSLIIPEPPKKSRNLHLLSTNIETNPFFEDECFVNSYFSCVSQCNNSYTSSSKFSPMEYHLEKFRVSGGKRTGLKRSETFHDTNSSNLFTSRGCRWQNENMKMLKGKNKNYIMQNTNNSRKVIRNREEGVKLSTSVSIKPLKNMKPTRCPSTYSKIIPGSYFFKTNAFPGSNLAVQAFTLKRHQNAGLHYDKNHVQLSTEHLNQVIPIGSGYPKRNLNGLKQVNSTISDVNIMNFPSGLY